MIRYIERRIDTLIDSAVLDHSPLPEEFDGIQFEGEWSLFRPFGGGRKRTSSSNPAASSNQPSRNGQPPLPGSAASRGPSPPTTPTPAGGKGFSSLRNTFSRTRASSSATPIQAFYQESQVAGGPGEITGFFDALQTLLTLSGVNPALITQMWSQILYWMSCTSSARYSQPRSLYQRIRRDVQARSSIVC